MDETSKFFTQLSLPTLVKESTVKKTNPTLLTVLRALLYIFAAIILVLGVLSALSLFSMGSALPNMLITLQAIGLGVFVDLLAGILRPVFINLGITILVIALVISLLAFATGKLIGLTQEMNQRLEIQERQMEQLRSRPAIPTTATQGAETHA
jgi:hypothetical protein